MSTLKHKCNGCVASFKLNVVHFAHICGNSWKTAAEFAIFEKLI